jgi:hypothetical protein
VQRLPEHRHWILSYRRSKVLLGVVEAVNANIKALLGSGYSHRD